MKELGTAIVFGVIGGFAGSGFVIFVSSIVMAVMK